MSGQTGREELDLDFDVEDAFDRARDLYHVPVLAAMLAFMLWNRVRRWQEFVEGDAVFFSGNDAWYHLRQTRYTVENWPFTMPFDPWTYYPTGTASGQFGTLYDQIVATAALVVGLGDPSGKTVAMTLLFAPAVFGTLTAIPVYYLGKRVSGRLGGLAGVLVLAVSSGTFLRRTLVGAADHQAAEVPFMAAALVTVMLALAAARQEKPVWELFTARDWEALRRPVAYGALAGVAIGLYMWVWPPGVLMVGLLALFAFVQLSLEYVRGTSPEHTAIVLAVTFLVAGLMAAVQFSTTALTVTEFSLVQPLLAVLAAAGVAVMAWVARQWDRRELPKAYYPVAFLVAGGALAGLTAVVTPETFGYFRAQLLRVFGFGASATALTVGEAQPLCFDASATGCRTSLVWNVFLGNSYGLAFYTAGLGAAIVLVRLALSDDTRSERLLMALWFVAMTLATFTQNRFDYYLVIPVAVLNGYLVGVTASLAEFDAIEQLGDVQTYQVVTVVMVVLVLTGPFFSFTAVAATGNETGTDRQLQFRTTQVGGTNSLQVNSDDIVGWDDGLTWMDDNTPTPGQYANADGEPMAYNGVYERTGDFQYPDGAYGVMSWWDYGHFITTRGERIPNANPFQQGATDSAQFLLATNETAANDMRVIEGADDGEGTRYVMLDWKLAEPALLVRQGGVTALSNKFGAPVTFYRNSNVPDPNAANPERDVIVSAQSRALGVSLSQAHFQSMRNRLYNHHGSAIPVQQRQGVPVVSFDRELTNQAGDTIGYRSPRLFFNDTVEEARQFAAENQPAQVGGVEFYPGVIGQSSVQYPRERVPALEHYRLVHATEQRSPLGEPYLKTFERVPGATVEGSGAPAGATVTAQVVMRVPTTNESFLYQQQATADEQGEFTVTLPYSTTGYDNWGPEQGYTNVSVRSESPYQFVTRSDGEIYSSRLTVPEGNVNGANETTLSVDLERVPLGGGGNESDSAGGDSSSGSESVALPAGTADATGESSATPATTPSATGSPMLARPSA
jgi:dolichyl-diphosphooligosaccharide--protein glycosyltransferase